MGQFFSIHPDNPQPRLLKQAVAILEKDGLIVYPTGTNYGLGCAMNNRKGVERIIRIKNLPASHRFSILCADLSDISRFARVDNQTYRLLKRFLPGSYTFVLPATREVPKTILPKRKTIGLRIPDNPICLGLLKAFGEPLITSSLSLPDEQLSGGDPEEIRDTLGKQVDLIVDGGILPDIPSTVVDLTDGAPQVIREGAGKIDYFT
ncbi:MAG: threonylcarbamoyl-AMP synthase [Magnetococcales bacterium]|nr:threonylcarbamoyl-AMP synthase [Magnetococcales bacterium]